MGMSMEGMTSVTASPSLVLMLQSRQQALAGLVCGREAGQRAACRCLANEDLSRICREQTYQNQF
jgi:hypothetical protein